MGAKYYGSKLHKTKNCLILDSESYRFQKSISDIAGHDIQIHENNTQKTIHSVRNWLSHSQAGIPGHIHIQARYEKFQADIPALCRKLKLSLPSISIEFNDYRNILAGWLQDNSNL